MVHEAILPECSRQNEAQWKKIEKSEEDIVNIRLDNREMKSEIASIKKEISQHVTTVVAGLTVLFELLKYLIHR